jgi:long-chain fatty acid transport protein
MKQLSAIAGALALSTTTAIAGNIERSPQSVALLFEPGNYAEFNFGYVRPKVSGTVGGGAVSSGDMLDSYTTLSFGVKMPINDRIDVALVLDEPIGADTNYPAGTPYPAQGATGTVDSHTLTALMRYRFDGGFSAIGGLRIQQTEGTVALPFAGYTMATSTERDLGYVVGVAYERPDIALRVALTYNSAIKHRFAANESTGPSQFSTTIPESVNLEFQTGIAPDTLLFGNLRWQKWSDFRIAPDGFDGIAGIPIVSYPGNATTLNLGLGRRLNENWSGAITLGYQDGSGLPTGNLGPTNGYKSIGLAATYTQGAARITMGVRYIDLGNATTIPAISGRFTGNHAIAAGVRVAYNF